MTDTPRAQEARHHDTAPPAADDGTHVPTESGHDHHDMGGLNSMAASATLHCLTGCAIGEIAGLMIGTAAGLGNGPTIVISIVLAFAFGYTLSTLPLLKAGLSAGAALSVVLAADTLSIATMEVFDNLVMAVIPGAMNAGLVNVIFWVGMAAALVAAFAAAYPVNRYLLQRGKGHALTHEYHQASGATTGARRFIPLLRDLHARRRHRRVHAGRAGRLRRRPARIAKRPRDPPAACAAITSIRCTDQPLGRRSGLHAPRPTAPAKMAGTGAVLITDCPRPAPVAQRIEQPPPKRKVAGSTPAWGTVHARHLATRHRPNRHSPLCSLL